MHPKPTGLAKWTKKFVDATRGVGAAMYCETSFWVHSTMAALVGAVGVWVGLSASQWIAITLCMTIVMSAEMFNSAIERLARAVTEDYSPHVRDALDMASGAVLLAAIGSAIVGLIVLGPSVWAAISG